MIQKISLPVSVNLVFNHQNCRVYPQAVFWNNRLHQIVKVGLHHTFRRGRTLYHVFSVATATAFLRLQLNSETLRWTLEEIADGLPS